jgi:aconitate hydratase 2/2-methylisocitrate dehydratase
LLDQVGTNSDSNVRFSIGLSLPAGSGLIAFAAATGVMPLDMPGSVQVRFHGRHRFVTLHDPAHAIPLLARQVGLLKLYKQNKIDSFSRRILEIDSL